MDMDRFWLTYHIYVKGQHSWQNVLLYVWWYTERVIFCEVLKSVKLWILSAIVSNWRRWTPNYAKYGHTLNIVNEKLSSCNTIPSRMPLKMFLWNLGGMFLPFSLFSGPGSNRWPLLPIPPIHSSLVNSSTSSIANLHSCIYSIQIYFYFQGWYTQVNL